MIGHTKAAAGVAGLIKAAMALNRKVLPPTIKVAQPLAEFADDGPVYVNAEARPWLTDGDHPRRAAVSAFGFGGSNFHCVLEAFDGKATAVGDASGSPPDSTGATPDAANESHAAANDDAIDFSGNVLIAPFAGDGIDELDAALASFAEHADEPWQILRRRTAKVRAEFDAKRSHRLILVIERDRTAVAKLVESARRTLRAKPDATAWSTPDGAHFGRDEVPGQLAFVFPGQGSQYVGMLRDLACQSSHAQRALSDANDAFARNAELNDGGDAEGANEPTTSAVRLSDRIYPISVFDDAARAANERALRDTRVAQPAIGAVSLGATNVLRRFNIAPAAVAGHSFGELTALCAAGWIDEVSFHRLACERGRVMAEVSENASANNDDGADAVNDTNAERGAMLAVSAPLADVQRLIDEHELDVVIANRNAPSQAVLSGSTPAVERAAALLESYKLRGKRLGVAAAFHSRLVAAAEQPFADALADVAITPTDVPVFANTTGDRYPMDPAAARQLLAQQLAQPVDFVREIEAMADAGVHTFVEVGPGRTLTGLIDAILTDRPHAAVALDASRGKRSGEFDLAAALAQLAALGHVVDLRAWDEKCEPLTDDDDPAKRKPRLTVQLTGANYVKPREKRPPRQAPLTSPSSRDDSSAAGRPATRDGRDARPTAESDRAANAVNGPVANGAANASCDAHGPTATAANDPSPATVNQKSNVHSPAAPSSAANVPPASTPAMNQHTPQPPSQPPGAQPQQASTPQPSADAHAAAPQHTAPPPHLPYAVQLTQQHILMLQRMAEQTAQLHRQYLEGQAVAQNTVQQLVMQQQQLLAAPGNPGSPGAALPPMQMMPPAPQYDPFATPPTAPQLQPPPVYAPPQQPAPAVPIHHPQPAAPPAMPTPPGASPISPQTTQAQSPIAPTQPQQQTPSPQASNVTADGAAPTANGSDRSGSLQAAAPSTTAPSAASTGSPTGVAAILLDVVADKTGYPTEMLEPVMSLDADLGIDSIKRVEILSALQERLPGAPIVKPEDLGALQTLQQIIDFLARGMASAGDAPGAMTQPGAAASPTPPANESPQPTVPAATATADGAAGDATTGDATTGGIAGVLLDVVAEKTGYPAEMLDPGMSLDADLGIDSIKRVEILSALQERLPDAPIVKPEDLVALQTLQQIIDFLAATMPDAAATEAPAPFEPAPSSPAETKAAPTSADDHRASGACGKAQPDDSRAQRATAGAQQGVSKAIDWRQSLDRSVLDVAPLMDRSHPRIALPSGELWVSETDDELAQRVLEALRGEGVAARVVSFDHAKDAASSTGEPNEPLAGLVLLAPAQPDARFVFRAFELMQRAGASLRNTAGALLACVTRLDGAFGLRNDVSDDALNAAGLTGLVKSARHEWPGVRCKAIDIEPVAGSTPVTPLPSTDQLAAAVADELLRDGPLEVGITDDERCELVLRDDQTITRDPLIEVPEAASPPLQPADLVIVTGGARGVTAEVAVALAARFRPTLLLLGRSREPADEPPWLRDAIDEPAIKQAIIANAKQTGDAITPKAVADEARRVLAHREVRDTLSRITAAGGRAIYRSVDVRDADALQRVIDEARQTHGPVRGLIHGAGVLADRLINDKTPEQFDRVYGTKVDGLRNLLRAADDDELRVLVTFSSSTARFGRKGQVDYAAANEAINKLAQQQAKRRRANHSTGACACRVISVNWGPWDGGMVTPALKQLFESEGVGVIPLDAGAAYLCAELAAPPTGPVEVVILGRLRLRAPAPCTEVSATSHTNEATSSSTTAPARTASAINTPTPSAAPFATPAQLPAAPAHRSPLRLAFERELAVDTHPILRSHVLAGRAVLPMALVIEWLAHGAMHHNPGLAFAGFEDLRIFAGVKLDVDDAVTLQVTAGDPVRAGEHDVVPVELRSGKTLHAGATVWLANQQPTAAPSAQPAPMQSWTNHDPYDTGVLFHGRGLRAIESIEACDATGIVARVAAAPPPAEWMQRPLRSSWIADPLALDAAFQLMIVWSHAQRGAPSLPTGAARYQQFARRFPRDGAQLIARVTRATDHAAEADLEWLDPAGKLIARMDGYQCVLDASLADAFAKNELPLRV